MLGPRWDTYRLSVVDLVGDAGADRRVSVRLSVVDCRSWIVDAIARSRLTMLSPIVDATMDRLLL